LWPVYILRIVLRYANGPQGRGYNRYRDEARTPCGGTPEMSSLPAHAINAGLRRRDRQRCNDHWAGARSAGTDVETAVCAHCREDTLPLVRTILRNG
jgi:hypothetical protein